MGGERKVDIIIPVYNALEDLKLCVESIKNNTDLTIHNLILLNDKSTDTEVWPYMQSLQGENIRVFNNEKNLGFSGNINKGIGVSSNDVILLNSDTVVTKNWVEKMVRCAYSDAAIGTVTPMSNNATLCSVPKFCEENKLPKGFTVERYSKLIEECSLEQYPSIPVAHGFCMYIKREVINKIGLFDAETFGRGYGEENDFCHRAGQIGYKHVMCDNTYIYHSGTSSFLSEEKTRYIDEHDRIVFQRYPKQTFETRRYCAENPNKAINDNIVEHTLLANGKKNIFYLLHSDFRDDAEDNVGGVQLHVKDLVGNLSDKFNFFVAARNKNMLNLTVYCGEQTYFYQFPIETKKEFPTIRNKKLDEIFVAIFKTFKIDLVHVHHIQNLSFEVFYAAELCHIPYFITLHDYYYLCLNVKMLNGVDKVCIGKSNEEMCRYCLRKKLDISETTNFLDNWRKESYHILLGADKIIAPSNSAKDNYLLYYPQLEDKIVVIEHGSDAINTAEIYDEKVVVTDNIHYYIEYACQDKKGNLKIKGWAFIDGHDTRDTSVVIEILDDGKSIGRFVAVKKERSDVAGNDSKKLKSGFECMIASSVIANASKVKFVVLLKKKETLYTDGKDYYIPSVVNQIVRNKKFNVAFIGGLSVEKGAKLAHEIILKKNANTNYFIFGNIGYQPLEMLQEDYVVKTGGYHREDLPKLVKQYEIDLICILPIWPETFCYTLSEAILANTPVVVSDYGALGERMKKLQCGVVVPQTAMADEIDKVIEKLSKDPQKMKELQNKVSQIKLRTVREMALDYEKLYLDIPNTRLLQSSLAERRMIAKAMFSEDKFDEHWILYQRLEQAEAELDAIKNATTYKFMKSLDNVHIPFRGGLKKVLKKVCK